jgi:hypothetical protein
VVSPQGPPVARSGACATNPVPGYACYNDGSIREWQFHAKQIASGKNFEHTGGFGPWMVTADEIKPNQQLKLITRLNGKVEQESHTGHMIFPIAKLIAYASTIFTLVPGDVIATGTPAGVGWSRKPPLFMKAGDICEVEIEGIGTLADVVSLPNLHGVSPRCDSGFQNDLALGLAGVEHHVRIARLVQAHAGGPWRAHSALRHQIDGRLHQRAARRGLFVEGVHR